MIGLWRLMAGFRLIYAGAVAGLMVATGAKTLTYLLLAYFVDEALVATAPAVPFSLLAVGFVGLAVVEGVFTFLSGKLAARSAEGATLRLRSYLFDHIQRLPFAYHDHAQTGDLIQRCTSDVETIHQFFATEAVDVGRIVLLFAFNFGALLSLNTKLAWLSLVAIPVVFVYSFFLFKKIYVAYEAHQEQEGTLSTILQENLTGIRVVKAFARQPFEIEKFEAANAEQYRLGRQLLFLHAFYWPVVEGISALQLLLIYFVGGMMVMGGEITLGVYLGAAGLVLGIVWPLQRLGRLIAQISTGLVSYNRVVEILAQEQEPVHPSERHPIISGNGRQPSLLRGEIEFLAVSLAYNGNGRVLHEVSFKAEPGQLIALLGPTGSGKSSLVNLLPRFYDYTAGSLLLDGVELRHYARHDLRRQIGLVEQEPFLFSRTIRENIAYGAQREVTQVEVEAAARAAAMHEVIMSFPDGYDTLVGEKGVTLSGGQKQRVAIARTLLKEPRILILDDAVSAVDTETEAAIHAALEALRRGRTTFVIAHRIQTLMQADKILVLEQGRVTQQGTHRELLAQGGVYRHIYDLQARVEQEMGAVW
jgi:ATP-binding cassette subfamily B protein